MAAPELEQLLRALQDRDLELGRDDVAWSFDSSQTKDRVVSWIQTYLSPPNLLTKEQLIFHNTHESTGLSNTAFSHYVSDSEYENAILELEARTAAVDKQCQLLQAQKEALVDLRAGSKDSPSVREATSERRSKFHRLRARVDVETHEMAGTLESRLQTAAKQADAATKAIPLNVDKVLDKDDRILDGLGKILSQLSQPKDGADEAGEVNSLCDALGALSVAEIRSRMDRAFASPSEIKHEPNGVNGHEKSSEQHASVQAEITELSKEIDGLATMAAENQYRTPITRALESAKLDTQSNQSIWSRYVATTLQYLRSRLDTLGNHSLHLHSHNHALKIISATLEGILAAPVDNLPVPVNGTVAPTRPNQKGLKPLRLVQANQSETQEPSAHLLRNFGITSVDLQDEANFSHELAIASRDKIANLSTLSTNSEQAVSELIAASLVRVERDLQDLRDAAFVYSHFTTVRLSDSAIEDAMARLEDHTQSVGDMMRELDMDGADEAARERVLSMLERS